MSDGTRRFATPPQQIAAYNKRIQPTREEGAEPSPPWVYSDKEYVVGDEVQQQCFYDTVLYFLFCVHYHFHCYCCITLFASICLFMY